MPDQPRVVSLLPAATEMVCAVGARGQLVGRSHECDFPGGLDEVPVLTRPRAELPAASGAIDRAVRATLEDALAVYEVDVEALRALRPNIIVTQDLCDVCAVSLDDVRRALAALQDETVEVCRLKSLRLADVWDDVRRVGRAVGRAAEGEQVARGLEARCREVAGRAEGAPRPNILTIEWLDPIMIGGTWMPELVALAGGTALVTRPGDHAPTLEREALEALDPDVVLVKPCGFDLRRTAKELELLATNLPWQRWAAVDAGRVFVADGNAYFNRPGPRPVESLEILAAITHGDRFADLAEQHRASVARVTSGLGIRDIVDGRPIDLG